LGLAVFCGPELRDWQVKNLGGRWSKDKMAKIVSILSSLIDSYKANAMAMKRLNPSRSSPNLNQLIIGIENLSRMKKLRICQYSIDEIKRHFQPQSEQGINKRELGDIMALRYQILSHELGKEQANLNPYYIRMFEAVALGSMCFHKLERH